MLKKAVILCIVSGMIFTGCVKEGTEKNDNATADYSTQTSEAVLSETLTETIKVSEQLTSSEENTEDETFSAEVSGDMPDPFAGECDDDSHDGFYLPFNYKLNSIPIELIRLRDAEVNSWMNSFSSAADSVPTKLNDYKNMYSFITDMNITREEAETALDYYLNTENEQVKISREQFDALFSGNTELITSTFSSKYSIVCGSDCYSPYWLYIHSTDDYIAAGIDAETVKEKAALYSDFNLTEDARKAFSSKFSEYIGEEIVIEPMKINSSETTTVIYDDIGEEVSDDDIVDEIIEE